LESEQGLLAVGIFDHDLTLTSFGLHKLLDFGQSVFGFFVLLGNVVVVVELVALQVVFLRDRAVADRAPIRVLLLHGV